MSSGKEQVVPKCTALTSKEKGLYRSKKITGRGKSYQIGVVPRSLALLMGTRNRLRAAKRKKEIVRRREGYGKFMG